MHGGGAALGLCQILQVEAGRQGRVGVVNGRDGQLRGVVLVEDGGQVVAFAGQQVLALVGAVLGHVLDLLEQIVVLLGVLGALVLALGLQGLVGLGLCRFRQLGDVGDALIGSLHRLHNLAHVIEQGAQILGAVVEAGSGEEGVRIVERRVDLLAGRELVLHARHEIGSLLQGEQVLPYGGGQSNISHLCVPFLGPASSSALPERDGLIMIF